MLGVKCEPSASPDFKQIVEKALALFAVYTGATLSFFVKDFLFSDANLKTYNGLYEWLNYWGFWVVLAVISLLLRYIVGSAAHLNYVYVPGNRVVNNIIVTNRSDRHSKSLCLLFVDLLFLIAFGILVVYITRRSDSVYSVMLTSTYFISCGLIWSLLALLRKSEQRPIAAVWCVVDVLQIGATFFIMLVLPSELVQAIFLAIVYLIFLFVDVYCLVAWMS